MRRLRRVMVASEAMTFVWNFFGTRRLVLLKLSLLQPQSYSIPSPANSGWHLT
eukprot:COSAG05_NODE_8_length_40675_cov_148.837539_31_plen_53_part_00